MAVPATAHWEVRTDGNNDNGGAFNFTRSGVDYPYTNTVYIYSGNLSQPGTDRNKLQVTSGRQFEANDVGNVINLTGGSGIIPGRYEIQAVSGGIATLDSNCWSTNSGGTGGNGRLGGAIAHPSIAARATYQSGTRSIFIWMKAGEYVWNSTQAIDYSVDITGMHFEGYGTTRGDKASYATWKATQGMTSLIDTTREFTAHNIIFDANGVSNIFGVLVYNAAFYNCRFIGFRAGVSADSIYSTALCTRCVALQCSNTGFGDGTVNVGCIAKNCGTGFIGKSTACIAVECGTGFSSSSYLDVQNCIAYNCTGNGFSSNSENARIINCTAYGSGQNGFEITSFLYGTLIVNCMAVNNGGYGFYFERVGDSDRAIVHRIRGYNNTEGLHNMTNSYSLSGTLRAVMSHDVTALGSNPFVDAANGDLRLKNTEPTYSQCKATMQSPPDVRVDWGPGAYNVGQVRQFDEPAGGGGGSVIVIEED